MIDDFSYTSTDPKTPAYFRMSSCDQHSDEQRNPFSRTGRHTHAVSPDDDSTVSPHSGARRSAQCVAIFSSYEDTFPDIGGFGSLSAPSDDRSDNIFGSAGDGVGGSADLEASSSLEARLFLAVPPPARLATRFGGDVVPGVEVLGRTGAGTVDDLKAYVLGAAARASPLDLEANRGALELQLFGLAVDEPDMALRGYAAPGPDQ